jgi:hypothetical protein
LGTITPVPEERAHEIKPLDASGHEIVPLDSAHTIRRLAGAARPVHEIRPLHDSTGAVREIVPLDSTVVPLDGSTWQAENYEGSLRLEFLVGGILRYTSANGTWTNGTWHQEGNAVTFEMNSHYADYAGHLRGTRMSGTAHNTTGRTWEWAATRE